MRLALVAFVFASCVGCSGAPSEPASPAVSPATLRPVAAGPTAATPTEAEPAAALDTAARAAAIAEAEAFVRAQGYADTPPTATDDQIVHEGIEGTIAD